MIAVARMIRTSDPVESDELKDQEREQLRRVDPLREIDLAADLLLDALKDPQRALNDPIVPVRRMALRATGDLLATDAILPPKNPKLIKKWLKVQKAKKVQEEQEKEQPKQAAVEQAAAAQQCGVCCEKEKEPAKPTPTPKPDEKPEPDPPSVVVGPDKLVILEPVHFALDKYAILPKSAKILKDVGTALKNHPEIKKVRVEGHTDVRHNDAHNQTLSENRVNSVVNWLVDKEGIDGDRLVGQGFGESRLLIKDAKTEAEHFKNRRVEFVITDGVVQPKPKAEELPPPVEQAPDAATSVPEAKGPQTEGPCGAAEPPKVEPTPPKVDPVPPDVEPEKKKDPIPVQPDKLVVPEVLFDFNKDTLTKQSVEILKGVVETLKNHPEIKHVDVEGHTDSRGLDAYNLDLSQRRMNRVVDFLVKAGIDGKRLSGVGKGETELKIKNAKTPDEHHQNRRVEFKITDGPGIPSENAESPAGPQGGQFEPGEPQVEPEQGPKTEGPKTEGPKTEGPKTQGPKNLGGGPGPTPLIKATAGPAVQTPPPKKTEEEKGAKAPKTEEAAEEEAETESQEAEAKEQTDQAADDAANPDGKGDAAPDGDGKGAEAPEGKDGETPTEGKGEPLPQDEAPAPPKVLPAPPSQKPKELDAKATKDVAAQFAEITPTQKALNYASLGPKMNEAAKAEQKTQQAAMPPMHAKLADQSPLPASKKLEAPGTQAKTLPEPKKVVVNTGIKGKLVAPKIKLIVKIGIWKVPVNLGKVVAKVPEKAPEQEKAKALAQELKGLPTKDSGIATSPGAPPKVPLQADADPALVKKATDQSVADAQKAKHEAQTKLLQSPGQELVVPQKFDETYQIKELQQKTLKNPAPVQGIDKYLALGLPGDVQGKFDEQQGPAMEKNLQGAKDQITKAVDDRDKKHKEALEDAEKKSAKLHTDAQKEQNTVVAGQRKRIHDERQKTVAEQDAAVAEIKATADKERAKVGSEIDNRVKADEAKIRGEYKQAEITAAKKAAEGEKRAAEEKKKQSKPKSLFNRLVGAVFEAISKAVSAIFAAIRAEIANVLNMVKKVAGAVISAATKWVSDRIKAFGTRLKGLIDKHLAGRFPALAKRLKANIDAAVNVATNLVKKIGESLKKGINALCDVVLKVVDKILAVFKGLIDIGLSFYKAMLTGEWGEFGTKILTAALSVAGIDVNQFFAMLGVSEKAREKIVQDPGAFAGKAVDAAGQGFQRFSDNFDDHLQKGMVGWLTGQLADIKIPEKLDAGGIFSIVLQVLGLDKNGLKKKAAKYIGEKNVERIEWVWNFVSDLLKAEEGKDPTGMMGLWAQIEESVGSLWEQVIDAVKDWVLTRVVMKAVAKLAMMFNPIGAIVQLLMTVWDLYQWFKTNVARIQAVITAWTSSLAQIAEGKTEPAVKKIEGALAGLVPVAISLLANLVGLGGIAKKVREIIEKIRAKIDKGIERFIGRVQGLFGKSNAEKDKDKDKKKEEEKNAEPDLSGSFSAAESSKSTAAYATIKKLNVKGTYKLRIAVKPRFENRYKKGDGKYELQTVHTRAKERATFAVANEVHKSGRTMFPLFKADAYKHYADEAKGSLAKEMADDGLKVATVKVEGDVPPLESKEKFDASVAKAKKKVETKVKKVTEPIRKKVEHQWNKLVSKAQQAWDKATAPVDGAWKKAKKSFSTKFGTLVEKSRLPAARDWLMNQAVQLGTSIENKALSVISVVVKPVKWALGVKEKVDGWTDKQKKKLQKRIDGMKAEADDLAGLIDPDYRRARKQIKQVESDEKKAGSLDNGWSDPAIRRGLWKRHRFNANGAVWVEVGAVAPEIKTDGPNGLAKTQIGAWQSKTDSLETRERDKVKGALSSADGSVDAVSGMLQNLGPLKGKDAKSAAQRLKLAGDIDSRMGRIKGPMGLAFKAFGGFGAAVEEKKKDETEKKEQPGWDDPKIRNRFAAGRRRAVAAATKIEVWTEVGEKGPQILGNAPRSLPEQVAFFRARLNDVADGAVRGKVADQLKAAQKALTSFEAMAKNLGAMQKATKEGMAARVKLADVMVSKLEPVVDALAEALKAFGSWEGMAPKTLKGGFDVPDSKKLEELLIKAGKTRVQLEKTSQYTLIKEARDLWRKAAGSDEAYLRETARVIGDRFTNPALDAVFSVDPSLTNAIAEDQAKAQKKKGLAGLDQDQAARERAEARVKKNQRKIDQIKIKGKALTRSASEEWLQTITNAPNALHALIVAHSEKLGLQRKTATPVAEPDTTPESSYVKAIKKDLGDAKKQVGKLLDAFKSDEKIHGRGWEFDAPKKALANCGKVVVVGLEFSVKAEVVNGQLDLMLDGLGYAEGLAHSWGRALDDFGPADAAKRAAFSRDLDGLVAAILAFDEAGRRLGDMVGVGEDEEKARTEATTQVVGAGMVVAQQVSSFAKAHGLPKMLGKMFQAALEEDTAERSTAGWSFVDVKSVVFPAPPRATKIGAKAMPIVPTPVDGTLKLQVGDLGDARKLHAAWASFHKVDPKQRAALDRSVRALGSLLDSYQGATDALAGAVKLDDEGKAARALAAKSWGQQAAEVATQVGIIGTTYGEPNQAGRPKPAFLSYKVKLGKTEASLELEAGKDGLYTVKIDGRWRLEDLVALYGERLSLEEAKKKEFDLLAELSGKGKAFKGAVNAFTSAAKGFAAAAKDLQDTVGADEEAFEVKRHAVAIAAQGVIQPLSTLWTEHGGPIVQDKPAEPAAADKAATATAQAPTPSDPKGSGKKGWEFAEAQSLLASSYVVRTPTGDEPLSLDLGKQPPVVMVGKEEVRQILDRWRRWLKITPGSPTRVTWLAEVETALGKIDKAFGTLASTTGDKPEDAALRTSLALAVRGGLVDIVKAYAKAADKPVKHGWEYPEAKVLARDGKAPETKFGGKERKLYVDLSRNPPALVLDGYSSVKSYADSWEFLQTHTKLGGSAEVDRWAWIGKVRPALAAIDRHIGVLGARLGEGPDDKRAREDAIASVLGEMEVVAKAFDALEAASAAPTAKDATTQVPAK